MEEIKNEIESAGEELESDEVWRSHIEYAKDFLDSDGEYCRRNGLSLSMFKKYKLKYGVLKRRRRRHQQKAFFHIEPELSHQPHAVQESRSQKRNLPDARWAAEFVTELMSRL